jgi:hypothetical protein
MQFETLDTEQLGADRLFFGLARERCGRAFQSSQRYKIETQTYYLTSNQFRLGTYHLKSGAESQNPHLTSPVK